MSFKVFNSSQRYSNINTSYLSSYNSIIDNLITTNIGAELLTYKPSQTSTIYTVTGYSPIDFANSSSKTGYFMNTSPDLPAISSYGPGVLTLPLNAYIIEATINVLTSILPKQDPYQSIMIGTQPIVDTTPLISGDIISGDSVHFVEGESFVISSTPLNRGQYIGGFLTYPISTGIPPSAVTVSVNFTPLPVFESGSFSIKLDYIIL
jgi:hypothetical protein